MRQIKFVLLLQLVINSMVGFSQNIKMTKEVEQIIELGSDSMIQSALSIIAEEVSLINFSNIKLTTNGDEIHVLFYNPIKYLPENTSLHFSITVALIEKVTYSNPNSNPVGLTKKNTPFFEANEESKKNILFVIESVNKCNSVGNIDIENFHDQMAIREKKECFDVSVYSENYESWYKVNKVSGEISDIGHAAIAIDPIIENSPKFVEIEF